MPATYAQRLQDAKTEVLDRLLAIVRGSTSESQVRLAAAVILRLPVPEGAEQQAEASPASTSARPARLGAPRPVVREPLTPTEFAALKALLPGVSPNRFLRKHTPDYWRDVLARAQPAAPPNRHAA